jgi:hypothetical protein
LSIFRKIFSIYNLNVCQIWTKLVLKDKDLKLGEEWGIVVNQSELGCDPVVWVVVGCAVEALGQEA